MSLGLCLILLLGVHAVFDLEDGVSRTDHITTSEGSSKTYRFHVQEIKAFTDLSVILTTFSDWTDPDLYMSANYEPTPDTATWKSSAWGADVIVLGQRELVANSDYYILVTCATYCRYRITASYAEELTLVDGEPQQGSLLKNHSGVYKYIIASASRETIRIRAVPTTGSIKMLVSEGVDSDPTTENSLTITTTLQNGKQCEIIDAVPGTTYKIAIIAVTESNFIVSTSRSEGVSELQASRPTQGEVDTNQFSYYKFYVDDPSQLVTIKITTFNGDPDVFVKFNAQPSQTDFDFKSEQIGDETLVITQQDRYNLNAGTGWYYIGVFGYYHSVFTVTVSVNNDSAVPLFNGNPQQGFVDKGQADLYYVDIAARTNFNMTVRLSPTAGDPNLYAKLCTGNLTDCSFTQDELAHSENYPYIKKSTQPFGDDVLTISHSQSLCPSAAKPCRYFFAVVGQSDSRSVFSIVATTSNEAETVMRDGRPDHMSLGAGDEKYYMFVISNTTVEDVTFLLTPEQGDPNLYVSRIFDRPNRSNAEKMSEQQSSSIDSVKFIRGEDGEMLNSTYHVTVRANTASTFSIVAKTTVPTWNSTIRLSPGHAQLDTVYNYTDSDYRIYEFTLHYTQDTAQPIHISLTPYTGKYTLYVANRPENLNWGTQIFYYNWCSSNASSTLLNIEVRDHWYRPNSTYLVLVQANEFTSDLSATYSITYSTGDTTVRLQEGVQFVDDVSEGNYKFYSFPVHESHEDISLSVTTFSGDPDLYLSVHPNNTKPDRDHHDFASNAFGGEVMTLNWEQGLRDICPKRPDYSSDPQLCMLYISVFGYRSASYSIKITTRKDIPELLVEGLPTTGQINETQYDYYFTYFPSTFPVEVFMQPLNGDPDLFINIIDANSTQQILDWPRPNKHAFDFSSQSTQTNDFVRVSEADLTSRCPSKACVVLAGVYCFSSYCRYSISTTQESMPSLIDGQSYNGYVSEHVYSYYSFSVSTEDASILISLTATSNGDPDLVVSKGANARPTRENCTWASFNYGNEHMLINADDPYLEHDSTRGTYIIGVYGFTNTTYLLTATAAAVPVVMLVQGQPHSAVIGQNRSNYYYFMIENESTVSVTLTLSSGSALILASKSTSDPYENLPTLSNFTWSSMQSNDRNKIEIKPDDAQFCLYCLIVIGVIAQDPSVSYSITLSYASTKLVLQNGVPHRDFIEPLAWQYYSFNVPEFESFAVSITSFSGNPDLYIGLEYPLTKDNAIWKSSHRSRVDYIKVKTDDDNFTLGVYTIGVFGVKASSYSITAHAKMSYITLVDGWPQTYSVSYDDKDFLLFWYTPSYNSQRNTYCRLMPLSQDFFPSMYYTFQPWGESKPEPSPEKSDVKLKADEYDSIFAEMKFSLPFKETGSYLIGVYGNEVDGRKKHELGDFELYCSSEDQFNILRVGYTEFEVLTPTNSTKRYEMHINEPGTLEIFVEPCVGKVSLGISTNFTRVNETDLIVNRIIDGKLIATVPHARGQYYITVSETMASSYFDGASYQLTSRFTGVGQARKKDIVPGANGFLQWEAIGRGEVKLYWSPVTYDDGTAVDTKKDPVFYRVYYTDKPGIPMLSACEMHAGELLYIVYNALDDGFTKETVISGEIIVDRKFLVNVVAYLRRGEGGMLEHVVYTPTEVYLPSSHPEGISLFIFVIISMVIIVSLAFTFIVYRRYKRVQSQLLYEMTDVRNVAGFSSDNFTEAELSSSRENQKYTPLVVVRQ